ncbi:MAG: hypothetical protein CMH23_07200 [Methylophaga sp.]|nr:hypothetical protein [Methylophaga sp.]QDP56605.1 MAG: hypothetical protein GOVbin2380_40 [Prokaryotic dsDNA virus sp.]|tara:strand:- start:38489 stop:38686 length:198 start_codon:yes stop_codon:yes gene_type:complete
MTLYEKTRDLLKNRPVTVTFASIEDATGIKESWLRMFNRGKIENPSVNTVQALYEHLSGTKLRVE